jgi:hypothetical protein
LSNVNPADQALELPKHTLHTCLEAMLGVARDQG